MEVIKVTAVSAVVRVNSSWGVIDLYVVRRHGWALMLIASIEMPFKYRGDPPNEEMLQKKEARLLKNILLCAAEAMRKKNLEELLKYHRRARALQRAREEELKTGQLSLFNPVELPMGERPSCR